MTGFHQKKAWHIFLLLPVFFFLAACAAKTGGVGLRVTPQSAGEDEAAAATTAGTRKAPPRVGWIQYPAGAVTSGFDGKGAPADTAMNFDRILVPDYIDAMMKGIFKANYYMDDAVRSLNTRITIRMTEDLRRLSLYSLFEYILALHRVQAEKRGGTYFFSMIKGKPPTLSGPLVFGRSLPENVDLDSGGDITVLVPFYNITPESLSRVLEQRLPPGTTVLPLKNENLLVINGNPGHLQYALELIRMLDRPQFKDRAIVMVTPTYWEINGFQRKVIELLEAEGTITSLALTRKALVFIPLERLNSLMVIAADSLWAERVLYWLEKLDVPEAAGEARNVYAYKLKNVEVASVVDVLRSMTSLMGKAGAGAQEKEKVTLKVGGEAEIVPIRETNTVVLVTTPVMYRKYREILDKIDVPRSQVFVEVIIGEVTLRDSREIGVEFWFDKYLENKGFGTKGGLGVGSDGVRGTITGRLSGTEFEILLNGLLTNKRIDIISTPKLTVAENAEAEISVGNNVPVISSESGLMSSQAESTTTNYYPYRSIQYLDTGIILKVKASVLTDRKIALELNQEVSEASENTLTDIASPEILKRSIKTTMIVREGETAFIGGLIQRKQTRGGTGIPFLSRIPLLGNLFKKSNREHQRSELVMFITARTLRRRMDMQEIVEGVRKVFSNDLPLEIVQ